MVPVAGASFRGTTSTLERMMVNAERVQPRRWQGRDVSNVPGSATYELMNVNLEVDLKGIKDLDHWRKDIAPNLPWADDHFLERVGGEPLNPGVQWANWPWAQSADTFREEANTFLGEPIFNHTYMERFWPKYARLTPGGRLGNANFNPEPRHGIAGQFGDLNDLVDLLVRDPYTRQAWIPLFFPEDTGWGDGGRKPCTLGYHFLRRGDRLHLWYPLRSCDLVRHFRDDCYLAVRLLLWVQQRCRIRDEATWGSVLPGTYTMHMTSLHVFENDHIQLRKKYES